MLFRSFLSLLFIGYVLSNINPRLGHTADVLPFKTAHAFDDSIWASVILRNGVLRVTTEDRKHFSWNALSKNIDDVREFSEYLKNRVLEITVSASLSKKVTLGQTHVILAVDQNLNYAHIKPIIYALAEAGISDYAFETKNVQ